MTERDASRQWQGWLFIGPALLFVAVFVLIPLGQLGRTSLTDRSLLGGGRFIGLEQLLCASGTIQLLARAVFTVKYTIVLTPILMGPRLTAGAADGRQHAAQASDPHRSSSCRS